MRRLLSLLREADGPDDHSPQPSLARLDDLVANVRSSGLPVGLTVTGARGEAPPGVELSAYRIAQEALTNVLRHAGPGAQAQVELAFATDHLDVAVTNTGNGAAPPEGRPGRGAGHGLIGIRERVAVVGGTVSLSPEPHGGFAVRARLPYRVEES